MFVSFCFQLRDQSKDIVQIRPIKGVDGNWLGVAPLVTSRLSYKNGVKETFLRI
jgi:hypothetical protein